LKSCAFQKLIREFKPKKVNTNIMAGVIYYNFEHKLDKFITIIKKMEYLSYNKGFVKLKIVYDHYKIHRALKEKLNTMKNQFVSNLKKKEQEIYTLKKTLKSQEESYSELKIHEAELLKTLNSKGKIIATLEQRKKPLPATQINENSSKKMKFYEEKVLILRKFL